ncbi:MFS general substrate transporter [Aspergillus steynii IBT 23096]|uniref:MFS general substrate transporter n=1 Tax=Aspergillus steynii IBT 23096 TaxID=1392250 RepID=A0A2I2G5T3_9EURO|nr:MFS general substrate transporter [Aspergillus steynii IBT 23096]PLB48230.1 MFS general substrate transporter [Aspergillus steynii IBT 23096]
MTDPGPKASEIEQREFSSSTNDIVKPVSRAPQYVRDLSPTERQRAEKRLVRKVDLRLMIVTFVMYVMNYLDRNNIAAARLAGLEEDLNLKGNQFQVTVSILFIGYLLMQVPSNMILNKMGRPSIYLPSCMVVWGTISTATAATHNYAGLLVCRFFLGFVEAAYFPGCLYLLSGWYTRNELVKRTALLYSGSVISGAFSGLIAAGITGNMNGARGLAAWRWLYIIEGVITIFIAILAFFIIPDLPRTTRWLSEEERQLAAWRLEEDIGEDDWVDSQDQSMFHGAKLAFLDYKLWLLLGTIYGSTSSGTVTNFFPTVMKGLGKGNVETLLLTTPPYLIGAVVMLANAWHADKTGERYFHIVISPVVGLVSFILAVATTSFAARYVAMCLMIGGIYAGYVVALGYISNVLPRPASKRAAALALINCLSNVCQVYAPYLYPNEDGPRYLKAFVHNMAMSVMTILFGTILRIVLVRLNKKLDEEEGVDILEQSQGQGPDGEPVVVRRGFRYLI